MKILSLFDGMSVAQQALKEAGIPVEAYYASEIDPYAIAVTQSNFPETKQLGDVSQIQRESVAEGCDACFEWEFYNHDIDLLIGGSPCQDLSIAKKGREGLSGSRSGLFWEYVRIRNEVKPKYFILENVASMPKEAKDTISQALGVQPLMINASLVSAQNRKRLFWVGKLDEFGTYKQVEITQPEDRNIFLKDILEEVVDEKYNVNITEKYKTKGLKDIEGKSGTLTSSMWKGYGNDGVTIILVASNGKQIVLNNYPLQVFKESRTEEGKKSRQEIRKLTGRDSTYRSAEHKEYQGREGLKANCITTGVGVEGMVAEAVALRNRGEGKKPEYNGIGKANAMTSVQTDSMVEVNFQIRKLTPTECLRLQSLPDDYFDKATYKNKPISNTQKYKMCGNAFNCAVIVHILKSIYETKQNKNL